MAFKKAKDYDDIKLNDYRVLPAGGYICRILKAEETQSKTGKDMVKVAFDIDDGEFAGFFTETFQSRRANAENPAEVKWPFNGTKWILLLDNEGATSRNFKSFCTALEESGTEVWINDSFDAERLKDAKVGIIFRREQHEYNNQTNWRTIPVWFRSVKTIEEGDFTIPDDLPLTPKPAAAADLTDSFSALDDDIPF